MKVLVVGSSGMIGTSLIEDFRERGVEVIRLLRCGTLNIGNNICWDPISGKIEKKYLENLDAVINLAGDNVASGRWTPKKKKKIWDSRVIGTQNLCKALSELNFPPKVLINASAIGYYKNSGDSPIDENGIFGNSFLSSVCQDWELATKTAEEKGIRVVKLRIGTVLSLEGGALKKMLPIFKSGFGGKIGSGSQYISWIVLEDLISIIKYCMENTLARGPINAVAPNPVTNLTFTKTLGNIINRPTFMPLPAFIVRVIFGEMGEELLLQGPKVVPKKLEELGFSFKYCSIEQALNAILKK